MEEKKVFKDNIDKVIELEPQVVQDPATAAAYKDSEKNKVYVTNVTAELDKSAEAVVPEKPEEVKVSSENMYTKKLKLDEDVFTRPERVASTTDEDFLDFDMFDFVYGLVADTDPKPKNPLGRRYRKFAYAGSDDYINNEYKGVPQVGSDDIDRITVYSDTPVGPQGFDDIKQICDMYKFKYSGPNSKRAEASRWNYSFTIFVPMRDDGETPMSIEEYFEPMGFTVEDVMGTTFARGRARRQDDKYKTEKQEELFKKWVQIAATNEGPLSSFADSMIQEMEENDLKFSKNLVRRNFMKEFEDDFEDED